MTGSEIKSLRAGGGDLAHAYGKIENGEAWLYSFHIAPYSHGNRANLETERPRKLLLHRAEIARFLGQIEKKGSRALVPLKGYLKGGGLKSTSASAQVKPIGIDAKTSSNARPTAK